MKVIVLESNCLVYMLIQEFYISVLVPVVLMRSSDLAAPGSWSNYQNRKVPCSFCNTLEWVSPASYSEPERLCSLTLNSFVWNKSCCALALISVIFLDCIFIAQGCCSHLDTGVKKLLYVHVDCYLMLLGCRKGFYQLEMCCSTSPLHSPSSA